MKYYELGTDAIHLAGVQQDDGTVAAIAEARRIMITRYLKVEQYDALLQAAAELITSKVDIQRT